MIEVELSGVKLIKKATPKQIEQIKDELTYDNPDYKAAKAHSKFGTGSIPPFNTYYNDGVKSGLIVPRGYPIPFPTKIVKDERFINTGVEYPKLRIELRGTQIEAVDAYIKFYKEEKDERGVIVLPTGKGKSILGLYLARKFRQKVLVIVQKDDLVDGWTQDANVIFGLKPKEVGLIKAKDFRIGKQVTITTIQTLTKLPPDKIRILHKTFGMVIADEMHRSVAKTYDLISYFPSRFKLGLTATAMRNDGLGEVLYHHFGQMAFEFEDTGDDEDILPVTVKIRNTKADFNPKREYKYNVARGRPEMEAIPIGIIRQATSFDKSFNTMLANDVIAEYKQKKSCVVFTHIKEHCQIIQENLIERGVPPEQIQLYYGDSKTSKSIMKRRAEERKVLITIATYAIATEGTNVKSWERGFLASTIANEKDTIQSIGRCRRTDVGKRDCIIYDYRFPNVIVAKNHGAIRNKVYKKRGYKVIGAERTKRKSTGRGWNSFR